MNSVEVEATYTSDGWPIPSQITWEGRTWVVVDVGRRWKTDDGIHLLARMSDGRVFELHTNGARWEGRLLSEPPHFA
jgi:hypothetical protein